MKLYLILFSSILISACHSSTTSNPGLEEFQAGIYQYSACDSTDVKVLEGTIQLEFDDPMHFKGHWNVKAKKSDWADHPHTGAGHLIGTLKDDSLSINLHPGWVDHNIFLNGIYHDGKIIGKWMYLSYMGWTDGGNFKAEYYDED
ncbi:MAG: hypothetical protein JXQ65_05480 [Candidatus Marinimicrobia bacterium]|nr:hypothetical protein [Candidatus Neomarinimicrobiota bacterium]